jgi:ATP-dependent DNA helicase PIF1
MLNEMRFGRMQPDSIRAFQSLSRPIQYDDGLEATELFPRREDVDRSNSTRLNALNTDGWTYTATDGGSLTDPVQRDKLLANFMANKSLPLKVDAQVMLIKNMDESLVNGSMGRIIGFCHKQMWEIQPNGEWQKEDTWDDTMSEEEIQRKKKQMALLESKLSHSAPLPVVRFKVPGGGFRDQIIDFDIFKVELPNGEVQVSRTQVRLRSLSACHSA